MTTAQKIAGGIVAIALVTTLLLPGRQTPAVIGAFGNASSKLLGTAMGTRAA